ncbi:hypothetical protein MML48_5g00009866 [Holotrichia oblita]|uniref:Uncharacterized protein n=1 Tax=Holotrichia oblita TaxID=644536 RepID=A0ACB9T2S9_HOLOL|nr:hypothetical protein MML48_5g00009866 [Holotrichia oblita]
MLAIQIKFKRVNELNCNEEVIDCVAKTCPPRGFMWFLFNTPTTFKKEIGYYTTIMPKLIEFCIQYKLTLDCYAKCYGARISSDECSEEVDEDACLLLENLKCNGYNTLDRFIGLDCNCTQAVIRDLAVFHAVPIAYKFKHPDIFESFSPILKKGINSVFSEEIIEQTCKRYQEFMFDKHQELLPRVKSGYRKILNYANPLGNTNVLFKTITHNDMWVNNIMTKFGGDHIETKFVDYQILEYSSLADDLVFFLYSSVQIEVLQEHCDDFIAFYYKVFIDTLKTLQCNVHIYTFDAFMEEISYVAKNQFSHLLCMLVPIYTLKNKAKDLVNFTMDDFQPRRENVHENFVERLNFIIEDFSRKNWI